MTAGSEVLDAGMGAGVGQFDSLGCHDCRDALAGSAGCAVDGVVRGLGPLLVAQEENQ